MVWNELTRGLAAALEACGLHTPERVAGLELAVPRDLSHGDWTTNLALGLAKEARRPPRQIAEALAAAFPPDPALFAPPEVAGPGFLNFRYSDAFVRGLAARIRREDAAFGRSHLGAGTAILVEYVSANPTGPLNIVSARAAAVGAALVRLLEATGHRATGEFYVKAIAVKGARARIEFLVRGLKWAVKRFEEALPKLDAESRSLFTRMRDTHLRSIAACESVASKLPAA